MHNSQVVQPPSEHNDRRKLKTGRRWERPGAPRSPPRPSHPPSVRTRGRAPTANTFLTTARYTSRESPTPSWRRAQGSRSSPGREMGGCEEGDTALVALLAFASSTRSPRYGLCSPVCHGVRSARLRLVKHLHFCHQQGVICSCGGSRGGMHRPGAHRYQPVSEPQGSCRTRHPRKDPCTAAPAKDSGASAPQMCPGVGPCLLPAPSR